MSNKDFKEGMVAGAKPFGDKLDQLANVSEKAVADITEGIDGVSSVVNCILDDLTVQEKKNIYDLDTPQGIAEMEQTEKEYLLAVLFTIADKKGSINDNQKFYLRALKTYLEIVDVQVGIDLSTIENIESVPFQKTIMQTVMEFLYLEYGNHDYMDDYEDYFDLFSVNRKGIKEVQNAIDHMVSLLGIEGLACHYSPLAEPEMVNEVIFVEETVGETEPISAALDSDSFENVIINGDTSGKCAPGSAGLIKAYKVIDESRTYEKKVITISGRFQPRGEWIFRNCTIKAENGTIWMPDKLRFEDCKFYIGGEFLDATYSSEIAFLNCSLVGVEGPVECESPIINAPGSTVENCKFETFPGKSVLVARTITECNFVDCGKIQAGFVESGNRITNCNFINCDQIAIDDGILTTSVFNNCRWITAISAQLSCCSFTSCSCNGDGNCLIDAGEDVSITDCVFEDLTLANGAYVVGVGDESDIKNCTYNNCETQRADGKLVYYY